jgi:dTDP-4-amino-4,6-dideoxygalactose transaminase/acetyltransferase-like isoleucine patch superfamily enzyme
MNSYHAIADNVTLGSNVRLSKFLNLYGCEIGDETRIGAFVEIQKNARVGKRCKISSHSFICEGVVIEDNVFIGHGVIFTNDRYPRATNADGTPQSEADWNVEPTLVRKGASIGSGSTILSKITIGENAIVGAGSVVTRDVPAYAVVTGNPARIQRFLPHPAEEPDSPRKVPFLDLITPHVEMEKELVSVFRRALHTAGFVGGRMVEGFERDFAAFCNVDHAVAVSSGTDALRFAIVAAGVRPGDEVITVPNTFIATTEAITQAGATIAFVDIEENTYNMSSELLRKYLEEECSLDASGRLVSTRSGSHVTAIVPVHLYGQMADMDSILEIAEEYGLIVIEDACQAHGAEYLSRKSNRWMKAGSMGRAAAFSFYPGKNLGACGEAGAVTTSNGALAEAIRALRDHGQTSKYHHEIEGYNGRLDAIQAGILQAKLPQLEKWNLQRRERAAEYNRLLGNCELVSLPFEPSWSRGVYHLYAIRVSERNGLMEHLKMAEIGTGVHYPIPLHRQKAYAALNYGPGSFPVTERIASEILSLPMYPQMTDQQQARVAEEIVKFATKTSTCMNREV